MNHNELYIYNTFKYWDNDKYQSCINLWKLTIIDYHYHYFGVAVGVSGCDHGFSPTWLGMAWEFDDVPHFAHLRLPFFAIPKNIGDQFSPLKEP